MGEEAWCLFNYKVKNYECLSFFLILSSTFFFFYFVILSLPFLLLSSFDCGLLRSPAIVRVLIYC